MPLVAAAVRVPASTSNLGAGFDCLGLAVARYLTARFVPGGAGADALRVERRGALAALAGADADDLLVAAFRSALAERGVERVGGTLTAESEIPVGRGLGSSAAAVVAGLALADVALGDAALDDATLDDATHGEPQGGRASLVRRAERWEGHADNVAPCALGGLVAVARDDAGAVRAFPRPLSARVAFAFAAPNAAVETRAARAALPRAVPHATAAQALGRLAALLHGLESGDPQLLAIGFADELHVPYRLPLIPGAGAAVAAARRAGAWAVTISGSGSGLIAATSPAAAAAVAAAMGRAFAEATGDARVIHFALEPDRVGVRAEVS